MSRQLVIIGRSGIVRQLDGLHVLGASLYLSRASDMGEFMISRIAPKGIRCARQCQLYRLGAAAPQKHPRLAGCQTLADDQLAEGLMIVRRRGSIVAQEDKRTGNTSYLHGCHAQLAVTINPESCSSCLSPQRARQFDVSSPWPMIRALGSSAVWKAIRASY